MTENKKQSLPPSTSLTPIFHTISAAQNKTSELFVKSFLYQGENIATKHLGQIFGFFEIPDTHEDNAYIVNFLASVVKKEYFVNPKRSATDSFEAVLHKVNLALTELVKQGNTRWLGKIHGVVSVIENNNFHFSVTGDAAILLYRDTQVTLVSEGLADKDAAIHPLKTFLEISSGPLSDQDKILVTSPELFSLCSPETLRKNAFRMDKGGFARFVKAALINELSLGVSIIIDLEPAPTTARAKKKATVLREESEEKLQNVFSRTSFTEEGSEQQVAPTLETLTDQESEELPPSEYTDKKTGHIYVQGETPNDSYKEPSFWQSFLEESVKPFLATLAQVTKRATKKSRKTVTKKAALLGVESKVMSQNLWKLSKEKGALLAQQSSHALQTKLESLKNSRATKAAPVEEEVMVLEVEEVHSFEIEVPEEFATPPTHETKRQEALARFSPHYESPKKTSSPLKVSKVSPSLHTAASFLTNLISPLQKFSLKQKGIAAGVVIIFIGITFFFLSDSSDTTSQVAEQNTPPANTPTESSTPTPEATPTLSAASTLTTWTEGQGMLVVTTDAATVVVTPKFLIANGKVIPFVANGSIEAATYMPDLQIIFLWSSSKELVSWSVVDQKFTANIFPLPANVEVSNLGAYLTYLYALDKSKGTIYRFARTEGGFGEGSSWLKTPLSPGSASSFVVNDTIRISSTTTDQYLRGTKEKTLSEEPYQILGSSSKRTFTLGVQTDSGKLIVWNADGNTVHEGTYEELKDSNAVTYNEDSKKLLVTKGQNLLEYSLIW